MKTYTIVSGVDGVGKTSLLGVLVAVKYDMGIIIDCDLVDDAVAIERINTSLEKGINFTQETTLSGRFTLKTIQRARELNYFIRLYYVGVNTAEESLKRIKNRVEKGGHDIPSDDVIRRYSKRFDDLTAVLPYCDEVYLYDNENGFVEVAEYKNGTLVIKCSVVPEWLVQLEKYLNDIK